MSNAHEILTKWAEYSKYDPNKKSFNIMSGEYDMHKCNENISKIYTYDPSGALAVMYAKNTFEEYLKGKKAVLFDVVDDLSKYSDTIGMWNIFCSEDVKSIENHFLNSINDIVTHLLPTKMLGERNLEAEKKALLTSVNAVVEQLSKCNIDLFLKGGNINRIEYFGTNIHVFERLADCLMAIETVPDNSMFLCYINNYGTADGYFGFYIKSNGNLLSINERINEAYPGQHKVSRNGRWSENKQYKLFPYNYMFSYMDHDYKGYATKHIIDEEKLAFYNLEPQAYIPIILAMVMLNTKYSTEGTRELNVKLVDSFFKANLQLDTHEEDNLIAISNSNIAILNNKFEIGFTSDDIVSGKYSEQFDYGHNKNAHFSEKGTFPTVRNIFLELYGDGFHLDTSYLLVSNQNIGMLTTSDIECKDKTPNVEFIGTENRMKMIAYFNARKQLAEHIRDKMFEEYIHFGGVSAVKNWWTQSIIAKKYWIYKLCMEKYIAIQNGTEGNVSENNWIDSSNNRLAFISYQEDCKGYAEGHWGLDCPLNNTIGLDKHGREDTRKACPFTGTPATIFFVFRCNNWRDIESIVGADNVPKIVKGWNREGHRDPGNPILNATDAVFSVGTPFEQYEISMNRRLWTKQKWSDYAFHNRIKESAYTAKLEEEPSMKFSFAVGLSKRGFNSIFKDYMEFIG